MAPTPSGPVWSRASTIRGRNGGINLVERPLQSGDSRGTADRRQRRRPHGSGRPRHPPSPASVAR